jgi:hypothetical protein
MQRRSNGVQASGGYRWLATNRIASGRLNDLGEDRNRAVTESASSLVSGYPASNRYPCRQSERSEVISEVDLGKQSVELVVRQAAVAAAEILPHETQIKLAHLDLRFPRLPR